MTVVATNTGWNKLEKAWLSVFQTPESTYVMLGGLAAERFDTLAALEEEVIRDSPWDTGCVFSETHMLKWKRRFGKWHALFLTDGNVLPEGFHELPGLTVTPQDGTDDLLLWGISEKVGDAFVFFEDRVPAARSYPAETKEKDCRAFLRVKRYSVSSAPGPHPRESGFQAATPEAPSNTSAASLASGSMSRWYGVCVVDHDVHQPL